MPQRLLPIWHLSYLLRPDYRLPKARCGPSLKGDIFRLKKQYEHRNDSSRSKPLLRGEGHPVQIPVGQKWHQLSILGRRGSSRFLLPFPGCCSATLALANSQEAKKR